MDHLQECVFSIVNNGHFENITQGLLRETAYRINLHRDKDKSLKLEVRSNDISLGGMSDRYTEGEFIADTDTLSMYTDRYISCNIIGLIHVSSSSNSGRGQQSETVDIYDLHKVTISFDQPGDAIYVVDWVENVDSLHFPNGHMRSETTTSSDTRIGDGENSINILNNQKLSESRRIYSFKIDGVDVYIISKKDKDEKSSRSGMIIYGSLASEDTRRKIRNCLSFAFGRPIVYLGFSEYSCDWQVKNVLSVGGSTFQGGAYNIPSMPPFPIGRDGARSIIDGDSFNRVVNQLYKIYDSVNFSELSWMYWHGVCSPYHSAAIAFGAIIEHLQKSILALHPNISSKLVDSEVYRPIKAVLLEEISRVEIGELERKVLFNKVSNLNQVPTNVMFTRIIKELKLNVSEVEVDAWKHRNVAAHGGMGDDEIETILNARVLRLIFNRMLARISGCSDSYFDYYSLRFPLRSIEACIPNKRTKRGPGMDGSVLGA